MKTKVDFEKERNEHDWYDCDGCWQGLREATLVV